MGFQKYMQDVKDQLKSSYPDDKPDIVLFTYSRKQVYDEILYFFRCFRRDLSAYKALTFFHDHLKWKAEDKT